MLRLASFARLLPIALALVAGSSVATGATAQSVPPTAQPAPDADGDTVRLSDSQRSAILDANTMASAAAARGEMADRPGLGAGIHGEVGVMIGSHGSHGAYGVADIPLGDTAHATVAVESSRYGYAR